LIRLLRLAERRIFATWPDDLHMPPKMDLPQLIFSDKGLKARLNEKHRYIFICSGIVHSQSVIFFF
jgi:hypothetical protein